MQERPRLEQEGGFVLLSVLVAVSILFLLGMATLDRSLSGLKIAHKAVESEQAFYLANAGLEDALSQVSGGGTLSAETPLQRTVQVAPGVSGTYGVTFVVDGSGAVTATSVGTVGGSTRQVKGVLQNPVQTPPQFQNLAVSNGTLSLQNHTDVCGDLVANGDVTLGAQTTVWNVTTAQDPASPCSKILGTGKVTSAGLIKFKGGTVAQGNWCDSAHYGTGYICDAPPQPIGIQWPDFSAAGLISQATRWYLTDCTGYSADACTKVAAGYTLSLTDPGPYNNDLVYVNGNILVPAGGLSVQGTVTFVATGTIEYAGNVINSTACTTSSPCAAAFISEGTQMVHKNVEVDGIFISSAASSGFTWDDYAIVKGSVNASVVSSGHRATFYPVDQSKLVLPKGVPGYTPGSGTFQGWTN